MDPLYKVVSILYATPGNSSSDGFTNSSTNGTTTTIGSSFTNATSVTYGFGWDLNPFGNASVGISFGASTTTGHSDAFTETIANASSISNASAPNGPNTINHDQDMLLIWLNPEANIISGGSGISYSMQTQYQNGSAEQPDIVEVTAKAIQSGSIPLYILQKQYDPATRQYDLPGLANICANRTEYQNNCPRGGQCGCVSSDFTGILASDPLLGTTTSDNPMNVDVSGVSACTRPTSADSCRYVIVPSTSGSSTPMSTLLSGPDCAGCNRPVNAYTQTDTTSSTQTLSGSNSWSTGYTLKAGAGIGPSISIGNTWTWTDIESTGSINGHVNQLQYSLSSSTVGCYQDILIYEDTAFHTFATQQAPGNNSCP